MYLDTIINKFSDFWILFLAVICNIYPIHNNFESYQVTSRELVLNQAIGSNQQNVSIQFPAVHVPNACGADW